MATATVPPPTRMALAGGPEHIKLFNENGRMDAKAIASELGIKTSDVARLLGKRAGAVRKTPDASSLQENLAPLVLLVDRLYTLFLRDMSSVRIWLHAPNRGLDGKPPMQYLLAGRLSVLDNLVSAIEQGFPS